MARLAFSNPVLFFFQVFSSIGLFCKTGMVNVLCCSQSSFRQRLASPMPLNLLAERVSSDEARRTEGSEQIEIVEAW